MTNRGFRETSPGRIQLAGLTWVETGLILKFGLISFCVEAKSSDESAADAHFQCSLTAEQARNVASQLLARADEISMFH